MRPLRITGDVGGLPDHAFGPASLGWWGTVGFMLIEGMAFVLATGAYFYLMSNESAWPPGGQPPSLMYGTLFTVLAILSEVPNVWLSRRTHAGDVAAIRIGLWVMVAIGVVLMVIRGFEFGALNVRWNDNAYGSILWALMLMHTVHIATDLYDTIVLAAIVALHEPDSRKRSDVADNVMYWHFVVVTWLAIYVLVYLLPGHTK
ncbi:cytochrome c oxidase subunit 3 [Luteibacter sp. W1I16]|uniref:cytochrome c oxidase subunit 3 n=1 Tax=Luteibacter sp. W1I16 TaxID=3373922 RepID=UPI003D24C64E